MFIHVCTHVQYVQCMSPKCNLRAENKYVRFSLISKESVDVLTKTAAKIILYKFPLWR